MNSRAQVPHLLFQKQNKKPQTNINKFKKSTPVSNSTCIWSIPFLNLISLPILLIYRKKVLMMTSIRPRPISDAASFVWTAAKRKKSTLTSLTRQIPIFYVTSWPPSRISSSTKICSFFYYSRARVGKGKKQNKGKGKKRKKRSRRWSLEKMQGGHVSRGLQSTHGWFYLRSFDSRKDVTCDSDCSAPIGLHIWTTGNQENARFYVRTLRRIILCVLLILLFPLLTLPLFGFRGLNNIFLMAFFFFPFSPNFVIYFHLSL